MVADRGNKAVSFPNSGSPPELGAAQLFELFTAHWTTALLASGVDIGVFAHLDVEPRTVADLARVAKLPERSAQALLDGLVGVGAIATDGSSYRNHAAASKHLVPGKPEFLGNFARIVTSAGDGSTRQWARLSEALRNGAPIEPETLIAPDHPFWNDLVLALAPATREVAEIAATALGIDANAKLSVLDLGGGSGAYASVWLPKSPGLTLTQVDWPAVNAVASREMERVGVADRFRRLDGDLHTLDWTGEKFDLIVISNIAHHEPPARNAALFAKARDALGAGGRLVVSDFVIEDDRSGPAFALRFSAGMVLQTAEGASYCVRDYLDWLEAAGFARDGVVLHRGHPMSTLVIATR